MTGKIIWIGLCIGILCFLAAFADAEGEPSSNYEDDNIQCRHFSTYVNAKGDTCNCHFRSTSAKCSGGSGATKSISTYEEKNTMCKYRSGKGGSLKTYTNAKGNPCECGFRGYAQCSGTTDTTKKVQTTVATASGEATATTSTPIKPEVRITGVTEGTFSSSHGPLKFPTRFSLKPKQSTKESGTEATTITTTFEPTSTITDFTTTTKSE